MKSFSRIWMVVTLVIGVLAGAPLLLAPGRFLGWVNWAPVDALLSRMMGAALLGIAWACLRALLRSTDECYGALGELLAITFLLGAVGFARHLFQDAYYPYIVWFVFGVCALLGLGWAVLVWLGRKSGR